MPEIFANPIVGRDGELQAIADHTSPLDIAAFSIHRQSVGHRSREICDQCPQPITNMIVKYGEQRGVKPRKSHRRGVYN